MDLDFGSGDVFWAVFWLSLWGAWVYMVIVIFMHILRDPELPGWGKAIWTAVLLLAPLIGVLFYLCFRGAHLGDQSISTGMAPVHRAGQEHVPVTRPHSAD